MHEMNGGRYSRASAPDDFKRAWKKVRKIARTKHGLKSDTLLFSLSFNSQDLPTTDYRPTQESPIAFCSERVVKNKGRCPRKADYYPGDGYVDLVGVTLYNRGRSRPDRWAKWKSPQELLNEDGLLTGLQQWGKPLIIDELGSTAINFSGERSQTQAQDTYKKITNYKNTRIRQWKQVLKSNPDIK
jgi:beta-mannanase